MPSHTSNKASKPLTHAVATLPTTSPLVAPKQLQNTYKYQLRSQVAMVMQELLHKASGTQLQPLLHQPLALLHDLSCKE